MEETKFLGLVEEILEIEAGTVASTSSLDDLDWDSLANITLIAEVDTQLGVSLNAERLAKSETVADLYALVSEATSGAK